MSQDLVEHLRFFQALGVAGVSRDPAWRRRRPLCRRRLQCLDAGRRSPDVRRALGARSDAGDASPARLLAAAARTRSGRQCTRCKLHTLGPQAGRVRRRQPERRADVRRRGARRGRRPAGRAVRRPAGQLLTKIIEAIELTREQVYIANVIKCRPPGNRNPEPDEVEQLRAVPVPADRRDQAEGDRRARQVRRAVAAADDRADHADARARRSTIAAPC